MSDLGDIVSKANKLGDKGWTSIHVHCEDQLIPWWPWRKARYTFTAVRPNGGTLRIGPITASNLIAMIDTIDKFYDSVTPKPQPTPLIIVDVMRLGERLSDGRIYDAPEETPIPHDRLPMPVEGTSASVTKLERSYTDRNLVLAMVDDIDHKQAAAIKSGRARIIPEIKRVVMIDDDGSSEGPWSITGFKYQD